MVVELTDDLAQATTDLDEYGYCLLTCPIPEDELHAVRKRLAEVMQKERDDGTAFIYENDNQRVFSLLNKGTEFADLVANEAVFRVMEHLLGYNFMLSSTHANVAGPGGASMNLHADQTFACPPWPPYALVANSMWMLDE